MTEEKEFYTIREAAEITRVSYITVFHMFHKGYIEGAFKVGNTVVIPSTWVKKYTLPDGYIPAPEAARKAGVSRAAMQKAVQAEKVDYIRRVYSGEKTYIYVNVKNAKWRTWSTEAGERSPKYRE